MLVDNSTLNGYTLCEQISSSPFSASYQNPEPPTLGKTVGPNHKPKTETLRTPQEKSTTQVESPYVKLFDNFKEK